MTIFLALLVLAAPETAGLDPVCDAAADVLTDMRSRVKPGVEVRLGHCSSLLRKARDLGVTDEPTLARIVAVAYTESNFRPGVTGKRGEQGMMQVQARIHCKKNPTCDTDTAGIRLLTTLRDDPANRDKKTGRIRWTEVLRNYNGSLRYGEKVNGRAVAALASLERRKRKSAFTSATTTME